MRCSAGHEISKALEFSPEVPWRRRSASPDPALRLGRLSRRGSSPRMRRTRPGDARRSERPCRDNLPRGRQDGQAGRSPDGGRAAWCPSRCSLRFEGDPPDRGSLVKPYVGTDCRCIRFLTVLRTTVDASWGESFRKKVGRRRDGSGRIRRSGAGGRSAPLRGGAIGPGGGDPDDVGRYSR